jgi:hypothetical protein
MFQKWFKQRKISGHKTILLSDESNGYINIDGEDKKFTRTSSVAYRQGTKEAIERVLEQIENQAEKRIRDGFSEFNFTLGVMNCFLVYFVFTSFPQHFWILYLAEGFYLLYTKIQCWNNAKPLNQIYYGLDFCWVMNFGGLIGFALMFLAKQIISESVRKQLFLAAYGTACGPLTGATAILPMVSILFHNRDYMTGFFIHFFPPLLFYVMRWEKDAIKQAWPNTFDLDYDIEFWPNNGTFANCVFGNTVICYLIWYVPYIIWQLTIGLDLPRTTRHKKQSDGTPTPTIYDTVYHSNMRAGVYLQMGKFLWNRPKEVSMEHVQTNDFESRDFIVYMINHLFSATLSIIVLAYPCYLNKYVHGMFLWILFAICAFRGAKRYTYYSTRMYAKIIRQNLANEIESDVRKNAVNETSQLQDCMKGLNPLQHAHGYSSMK